MNTIKPKIYIACLAAYNNGYLHGKWIDADQNIDALWREVKEVLASSPVPDAEEFAIHDYEGFGDITIHEYSGLETVSTLAEFVCEHGELGAAVLAYCDNDIDETERLLEECYHGEYDSEEDFAATLTEDTTTVPKHLAYYIDYARMARDWFISDFFSLEVNRKTHVFSQV